MKAIVALFALLLFAQPAVAQQQSVESIEVTEYGLYTADSRSGALDASGNGISSRSNITHVSTTTEVPARLGVHFGYRYVLHGSPKGAAVQLRAVTVFPPGGLTNPATGQTRERSEYFVVKAIDDPTYRDYSFDAAWEMVPGPWRFELWHEDRMLSAVSFTVVAAD
jgi:hypothetical protein